MMHSLLVGQCLLQLCSGVMPAAAASVIVSLCCAHFSSFKIHVAVVTLAAAMPTMTSERESEERPVETCMLCH